MLKFSHKMRAADEAASQQRQQRQQEGFRVLQETPASQFASSSHVPHLLSLVQSMQSHHDKYNNHSFLRHLEKEIYRREANSFINMSPENRASFFGILTLALKLSDKDYIQRVLEAQNDSDVYMQKSIDSAKSLLHDLLALEDLVEKVSGLQGEFARHA